MRGKIVAAETAHDAVRRYVNSAADRPRTIAPRTLERIHADTLPACQTSTDIRVIQRARVGGACGPPPPVAAPLASSLRAPSRGDPPRRAIRARKRLTPGRKSAFS